MGSQQIAKAGRAYTACRGSPLVLFQLDNIYFDTRYKASLYLAITKLGMKKDTVQLKDLD
jgi:hypothetical protein